jgi:repressor LexA
LVDYNKPIDKVYYDPRLLGYSDDQDVELFITTAKGNGMTNAGVHDNDLLICEKTQNVVDGDLVVVNANGESMIRRFFKNGKSARLKRENGTGEEIIVKEYTIVGKLLAIQRRM